MNIFFALEGKGGGVLAMALFDLKRWMMVEEGLPLRSIPHGKDELCTD